MLLPAIETQRAKNYLQTYSTELHDRQMAVSHAQLAAISETGDAYCCRCRDDRGWLQRGLSEDASVSEARLTGVSQLGSSCGGSACVGVALAHLPSPNTPRRVEGRCHVACPCVCTFGKRE